MPSERRSVCLCMPKERFTEELFLDVMDRLVDTFANEYFHLQIYMGVYEITDVTEPVFVMVDKCNLAINTIKGDYARRVAYFDDALLQKKLEKNLIINEFEQALELGQIRIYLQAQTRRDGSLLGAEALARWIHPIKGLIAPDEFIPVLESAGLVHKLDLYVWDLAARQLAIWRDQGRMICIFRSIFPCRINIIWMFMMSLPVWSKNMISTHTS